MANSFEAFRKTGFMTLTKEKADTLQTALRSAYSEHSYETIAQIIREGKLCFVDTGWQNHGICLVFLGKYMAICNRGERGKGTPTLAVRAIDPSLMTPKIIEEIFMHADFTQETGQNYFYNVLLKNLATKRDSLTQALEGIAPKASKEGTCALASKKAALRFVWAMLLSETPNEQTLKQARLESKLFTDWSANQVYKGSRFPLEGVIKQQAEKKAERKHLRMVKNLRFLKPSMG